MEYCWFITENFYISCFSESVDESKTAILENVKDFLENHWELYKSLKDRFFYRVPVDILEDLVELEENFPEFVKKNVEVWKKLDCVDRIISSVQHDRPEIRNSVNNYEGEGYNICLYRNGENM
jgi:hypothetical protein